MTVAVRTPQLTDDQRIVVTGMGVVSPLGSGLQSFWRHLMTEDAAGAAAPEMEADFSGRISDFGELPGASRKQLAKSLKVMNRETQLGVAAGLEALSDSALAAAYSPERIGIAFGAGNACVAPEDFRAGVQACADEAGGIDVSQWGARGLPEMAPLWLLRCLPNMAACHLAILANLQGPSNTITQQSLGVDLALAEACRILRSQDADAMLVGGSGTTLTGLDRLHAVWGEGQTAGIGGPSEAGLSTAFIPSEGAAALVLETLAAATHRGARIYGEVLACVTLSRGRRSTGEDLLAASAMETLQRCGLTWDDVGHVHLPDEDAASALCSHTASGLNQKTHHTVPAVTGHARWGDAGAGTSAIGLVASLLTLGRAQLFGVRSAVADEPGSPLRWILHGGEPAGETCLKLGRLGNRQATGVALARVPA